MRCLTIGPCHDVFGGSKQSGTSTTISNKTSVPGVEDALGRLVPQVEQLGNTPVQQPGFDTVVPFSEQTEDALQLQELRALEGSPLTGGASDLIQQIIGGDFLQRENAGFDQFANQLTGDIGSRINAQFANANRLGSQGNAQALGRGIGDALSDLRFRDFERERQNQLGAAEFAPQLANVDFQNLAALRDVGAQREGQLGATIQDQLNRFNFAQQEPRTRIAEVLALLGGGQFSTGATTTTPTFQDKTSSGISNLAGIASIGGSLFGGDNPIFKL